MIRTALLLLLLLNSASSAFAWSSKGHIIVALIAERHLSREAKVAVEELLASEGRRSITEIALWADRMKHLAIPLQPMHSVYLEGDNSPYDAGKHCKNNRCVIGAIDASMETLRDLDAPIEARTAALKYLVHFFGDVHTPLHATVLGRGVKVIVMGREYSLHKVWDGHVVASRKGDIDDIATDVERTAPPYSGDTTTPIEWALESRSIARDRIMTDSLRHAKSGDVIVLPSTYAQQNWPIARDRLNLAGRRLADTLNRIFIAPPRTGQ